VGGAGEGWLAPWSVSISLSNPPAALSAVFQIALLSPDNAALQMPKEDPGAALLFLCPPVRWSGGEERDSN